MECICQKCQTTKAVRFCHRDLIGQIAVGLAHEIRNPLTVIKGYLQLQDKSSAYCTGESRRIIYQEVSRLEELLNKIILLAQNKASNKMPANLSDILANVYPAIQQAAGREGIETELVLDDSLPILQLNTNEIEQLVMHLADNGIEAMQTNGKLTIKAACEDGRASFSVQDQGSGIAEGDREQIFTPFYTTKASNTGLGLAISLSIVERHQGQIEFVSTVGAGSLFKVLFPAPK